MKNRFKKLAPMLALLCFFAVLFPQQEAEAGRIFGWDHQVTHIGTTGGGGCYVTVCSQHFFLGIPGPETCRDYACGTEPTRGRP